MRLKKGERLVAEAKKKEAAVLKLIEAMATMELQKVDATAKRVSTVQAKIQKAWQQADGHMAAIEEMELGVEHDEWKQILRENIAATKPAKVEPETVIPGHAASGNAGSGLCMMRYRGKRCTLPCGHDGKHKYQ